MRRSAVSLLQMVAVVLLAGCGDEKPVAQRPVLSVIVEEYQEESLGRFSGTIQARYQTTLGFLVGGRVVRRLVDAGERVEQGTLLAELDPTDQQTILRRRQAELTEIETRYRNVQLNVRRQQQLFDRGVGSRSQLEQLQVQLSNAHFMLEQARNIKRQAADLLSYSRLYSEHRGVVTAWHAEVGQTVVAGQNVLTLAREQEREAVFDLPAELLDGLPSTTFWRVRAELEPGKATSGRIRELAPEADPITRTRRVRLALEQVPREFHLGTSVVLELSVAVSPRTRLPASALWFQSEQAHVWVIDPVTLAASSRQVEILSCGDREVVIGAGLVGGERVVVAGVNNLLEGQVVRVNEDAR